MIESAAGQSLACGDRCFHLGKRISRTRGAPHHAGRTHKPKYDLITQKEAAELRGVTQAAIGDLIRRGRLRTAEIFGRVLVYRSEVE